jgi:hypothetical protein
MVEQHIFWTEEILLRSHNSPESNGFIPNAAVMDDQKIAFDFSKYAVYFPRTPQSCKRLMVSA